MKGLPPLQISLPKPALLFHFTIAYDGKYQAKIVYETSEETYSTDLVVCEGLCELPTPLVVSDKFATKVEVADVNGNAVTDEVEFGFIPVETEIKALDKLPSKFAENGYLLVLGKPVSKVVRTLGQTSETAEGKTEVALVPVVEGMSVQVEANSPAFFFIY